MTQVLDKGYVNLLGHFGDDKTVVDCARVSYLKTGTRDRIKDEKLIDFLMKNEHTSPFEMVEFRFEIKAPIFVARQWMRHRMASYNEVSARYSEMPEEFYFPTSTEVRGQGSTNKQVGDGVLALEAKVEAGGHIVRICQEAYESYSALLALGVCREQARMVLPVNLYTRFIYKVDLHNLLRFLKLRLDPHAQWEIRQYAKTIVDLMEPVVPVTLHAWRKYVFCGSE